MLSSTTYLLAAVQRAMRSALAPRLSELGVNYGADLALVEIGRGEGLTQGELALRLNVTPPSVTKVLRALERAELIYRLGDESDGRVSRVHLTAAGQQCRRDVEQAWREAERMAFSRLSGSEQDQLRRLLARAVGR